ncbi:MAG: hypothetical protein IIB17_08525 [Chloroflexi bacterium]|nr:hypothetical protein [Chloroflexota bacterium]
MEVDEDPGIEITYLTYVTSTPLAGNEWTVQGLYLDASTLIPEITDPGVFNPGEEMVVLANPFPVVTKNTYHRMRFTTPNGYSASVIFYSISPNLFLESETTVVGTTTFRNLEDGNTADGPATTTSATFSAGQTGRVRPSPYEGRFVFPLAGITELIPATWDMIYRVKHDHMGFTWFTNAFDISLSTTGSWQDIDVSTELPAGATGAIVEVVNTGTSTFSGILRGKEDTRDYMSNPSYEAMEKGTLRWQIVKLDDNLIIQGFIDDTDVEFQLLGYTSGADPEYNTTPINVTPGTTGSWTTVDVSAFVDADADGVILSIDSIDNKSKKYGIREAGSSFSKTDRKVPPYGQTMYVVGIDDSDQFDAYIDNSNIFIFLVAQTKGSVVYYTDDEAVSDPSTGSWQTLDADDYVTPSLPSNANGLMLYVDNSDKKKSYNFGVRNASSTDTWTGTIPKKHHMQVAIGINDAHLFEEYINHTDIDVSIAAYTRSSQLEVHADVDILIRKANGIVRDIIGVNVANTSNITSADWQTLIGTFDFPGYTVVQSTDYLEIDLFAEATSNGSWLETTVDFDIDDPSIPPNNQTHLQERVPGT